MYLNLYQKYILELLAEYDGLPERQLEALVKHFKEPHLYNINGYLEQLRRFDKIEIVPYRGEDTVILLGGRINEYMVTAFDIMLQFIDYLKDFERGNNTVLLRFYVTADEKNEQEINIVPVEIGREDIAKQYADEYVVNISDSANALSHPPSWIFVIQDKKQISLINPDIDCSFVLETDGEIVFYER
ncbi:MAG: hypothetical protein HFE49_05955 [Clostridia bacterium]|nr:hypothetical protein [Clostridia bacterium]